MLTVSERRCQFYEAKINPFNANIATIETSQLVCTTNQLIGFLYSGKIGVKNLKILPKSDDKII